MSRLLLVPKHQSRVVFLLPKFISLRSRSTHTTQSQPRAKLANPVSASATSRQGGDTAAETSASALQTRAPQCTSMTLARLLCLYQVTRARMFPLIILLTVRAPYCTRPYCAHGESSLLKVLHGRLTMLRTHST